MATFEIAQRYNSWGLCFMLPCVFASSFPVSLLQALLCLCFMLYCVFASCFPESLSWLGT